VAAGRPGIIVEKKKTPIRHLPRIGGFHGLRHSFATLALAANVHPKVVQEILGHANVGITLDLYSHVVPGMQAEATARVAALFLGS
jgi:integrase